MTSEHIETSCKRITSELFNQRPDVSGLAWPMVPLPAAAFDRPGLYLIIYHKQMFVSSGKRKVFNRVLKTFFEN